MRDFLSCRMQMYLHCTFHSNPTLSHWRFRHTTVDYLYCFPQESRNTQMFLFKWIMGNQPWCLLNLADLNYNLGKKPFFLASSISYPSSIPLWESRKSLSSFCWLVKVLDVVYFWSSVVQNSVAVCFSDRFLH